MVAIKDGRDSVPLKIFANFGTAKGEVDCRVSGLIRVGGSAVVKENEIGVFQKACNYISSGVGRGASPQGAVGVEIAEDDAGFG